MTCRSTHCRHCEKKAIFNSHNAVMTGKYLHLHQWDGLPRSVIARHEAIPHNKQYLQIASFLPMTDFVSYWILNKCIGMFNTSIICQYSLSLLHCGYLKNSLPLAMTTSIYVGLLRASQWRLPFMWDCFVPRNDGIRDRWDCFVPRNDGNALISKSLRTRNEWINLT